MSKSQGGCELAEDARSERHASVWTLTSELAPLSTGAKHIQLKLHKGEHTKDVLCPIAATAEQISERYGCSGTCELSLCSSGMALLPTVRLRDLGEPSKFYLAMVRVGSRMLSKILVGDWTDLGRVCVHSEKTRNCKYEKKTDPFLGMLDSAVVRSAVCSSFLKFAPLRRRKFCSWYRSKCHSSDKLLKINRPSHDSKHVTFQFLLICWHHIINGSLDNIYGGCDRYFLLMLGCVAWNQVAHETCRVTCATRLVTHATADTQNCAYL